MADDTMIYDPMGMSDMTSTILGLSHELDQIGQEAHNLLAASQHFFKGPQGATHYAQAQQAINEGIQDGQRVLHTHSNTIDHASTSYSAADHVVGNSFNL